VTAESPHKNAAEGENQGFQFGGAFIFILMQITVTLSPLNDKGSALDPIGLCLNLSL